jgi:hypothetical protein
MRAFLISAFLLLSKVTISQITYVDNFDGVYPLAPFNNTSYNTSQNFDLNNDGQLDIELYWNVIAATSYCTTPPVTPTIWEISFKAKNNVYGLNKVNCSNVTTSLGIDCTNDTLNSNDQWNNLSLIHKGAFPNLYCLTLGYGTHKQGFRLIMTNPANGALGYKYGYIDYSLTNGGDIIIHGWYYENAFNVPIVANSQLDYPYDGNCIHYDTVTVYDTITTQIYDTVLVSVTDTLYIETTLSTSPLSQNTISVFPNPTNDHITINTGNFALMPNYSIKIENSLGQVVFTNPLNQQSFYVDLNGWSGNGVYYLKLLDAQNNEVTVRKIVLQ